MAIKIPRGEISIPSVGNRGNSMLNAVQSNKINYNKLTNVIDAVGTSIKAHNDKIETQRIDNKNTKNKSLLQADINLVLESIANNEELSTDGKIESYNGTYNSQVEKLTKKYKKLYKDDDDAFAQWESDMYNIFNNGQINMWKDRRKKVLAEAQVNFESGTAEFNTNLDSIPLSDNIWEATNLLITQEKERFKKAAVLGIKVDFQKHMENIEDTVWKKVISSGHQYIDHMTDKPEIDYQTIYNTLNSSAVDKKWMGKTMTLETRNGLLEWAKGQATEQKTMMENTHARIDNENSQDINTKLSEWRVNKLVLPEGETSECEYIKNLIHNTKLTDTTKDSHYKELETVWKNKKNRTSTSGSLTHGDPQALNEHFDQIILGNSQDHMFIQRINQDDRLTAKGKEMLIGWATEYNKNRNSYKDELVTNFMKQFDAEGSGYDKEMLGYLRAVKPNIFLELNKVLAEGEAAGISYHAMLGDTTSEYYVGFKFLEIYQTTLLANMKTGNFNKVMQGFYDNPKDFFAEKRGDVYSAFFDTDMKEEGNQLAYVEVAPETDDQGNVVKQLPKEIDTSQAIFTQRLLNKPIPPAYAVEVGPSGEEGKKESIESYINSAKYKKYQKAYRNWIYEGDFNSNSIPTINKYFSVTDMPTSKIKN